MNTDPAIKLARQKLSSVLQLAQALGNVTEAYWQRGVSRTSIYEHKKRIAEAGQEGLKDLTPIVKFHPFTKPEETVERIVTLRFKNPNRGCNFISDLLLQKGTMVSYPTVQNILNKRELGSKYDRWLWLEEQTAAGQVESSETQLKFLRKDNPIWREQRQVESRLPRELLCQSNIF